MAHIGRIYEYLFERDLSRFTGPLATSPKRFIFKPLTIAGSDWHHWNDFINGYASEDGEASYTHPGSITWDFPPPPLANPATFVRLVYELSHDAKMFKWRIEAWKGSVRQGYLQKLPGNGNEGIIEPIVQFGEAWVVSNPTLFGGIFIASFAQRRWDGTSIP